MFLCTSRQLCNAQAEHQNWSEVRSFSNHMEIKSLFNSTIVRGILEIVNGSTGLCTDWSRVPGEADYKEGCLGQI